MKQIVLIGDSVCGGYTPVLSNVLKETAEIWCPDCPVGSTVEMLAGLREWVLKRQPDYVVLAAGMVDTRSICFGESERITPLSGFGRNVERILKVVLERSTAVPLWATITPVDVRRVSDTDEFGYDNETIAQYNEEAKEIARRLGVEVLDLYGVVKAASRADSWRPNGICFDERSSDFLADWLAGRLREICKA